MGWWQSAVSGCPGIGPEHRAEVGMPRGTRFVNKNNFNDKCLLLMHKPQGMENALPFL